MDITMPIHSLFCDVFRHSQFVASHARKTSTKLKGMWMQAVLA